MAEVAEQIKTIATDLAKSINDVQEELKQYKEVSKGSTERFEAIEAKYTEIEKGLRSNADLADELNKELGKLKAFGAQEEQKKGLKDQIIEKFKSFDFDKMKQSGQAGISGEFLSKAVGTISTGNLTGALNTSYLPGVTFEPRRKTHIRSLISSTTMSEPTFTFRRAKTGEGGVGIQTEGSSKAQIDYDFETKVLTPVTIAVFSRQTLQAVRDLNWLGSYVSDQMVEDLLVFEDGKLLDGPGGAGEIEGIRTAATAYTPSLSLGVLSSEYDYLLDAWGQLETANYSANMHLIHPMAWVKMLLRKSTTNEYDHPILIFNGQMVLGATQIVASNALSNRYQFVSGDFTRVTRLERENISVALSYDDADNFTKNLVTIRVEESITQAIYNPAGFRAGSFGALGS